MRGSTRSWPPWLQKVSMEIDGPRGECSSRSETMLSGNVSLSEYHGELQFNFHQEQPVSRKRKSEEIFGGNEVNVSSSDHSTESKSLHFEDDCLPYENSMIMCDPRVTLRALQGEENLADFDNNALFSSSKAPLPVDEDCPEDDNDIIFYSEEAANSLPVDLNPVKVKTNESLIESLIEPLPASEALTKGCLRDDNRTILHDRKPNHNASLVDENGVGDADNVNLSDTQQASKVIRTIETFFENEMSLNDADISSNTLHVEEDFVVLENNSSLGSVRAASLSFHKSFLDVTNARLCEIQSDSMSLQAEESFPGIVANMSPRFPEESSKMSLLEEIASEGENQRSMSDLLSPSELSPAEENEGGNKNDACLYVEQSVSKRRKLILTSALASVFSTLTVTLASVGELLVQLQDQMREMSAPMSSYCVGESSWHRYFSGLQRSSSSLQHNRVLVFLFLLMLERERSQKRARELTGPWYIKPRSVQLSQCFLNFSPREDPERFRELFRLSPDLFYYVCDMVSEEMLSDTPRSLRVLPNRVLTVERQVAIALRRLATGNQFLGIADSFGVSKSTAVKVTWKFVLAFIKKASSKYLRWPQGENMQKVKDEFKSKWGFPNCCGVVDGTHFTVEFPKGEDVTSYYDCKDHVSISMQAIVDSNLRFLDVVVGWPGSIQDSQLLSNTNFYKSVMFTNERLNGDLYTTPDGSCLREYILGDGGYPLYDWLIVPYVPGLSAAQDAWNSRHAAARVCADDALRRLKGTWRLLSRILWKPRKERIGKMVFACCLLHNMIIEQNDGLSPRVYEGIEPHPGGYSAVSVPCTAMFEGGPEARDILLRQVT